MVLLVVCTPAWFREFFENLITQSAYIGSANAGLRRGGVVNR